MQLRIGLMAAVMAFGYAGAKAESTKVEDFEGRSTANLLGGFWYFYDDRTDSGSSVITTVDTALGFWDSTTFAPGAEGSASAVKLGFKFGATNPKCGGVCTYPPMVGMGTNLQSFGALDLTGATALTFWAKADAPLKVVFSVGTTDIKDNGNFAKLISLTSSWTKYTVSLAPGADLKQPTWAKQVAFNPAEVVSFGWSASKGDNASVTVGAVYLDQVVLENWVMPVDPTSVRKAFGIRSMREGAQVDALGRTRAARAETFVPFRLAR